MASSDGRQRLSTKETRDKLIDAGCELLRGFGLQGGMGVLSFADSMELADVPRTSAYRAFPSEDGDPQAQFRVAVMLEAIDRMVVDTSYVAMVLAELTGFEHTPEGRAAELRELIRRWTQAALDSNLENDGMRTLDALHYVAALSSAPDEEMLSALRNLQVKGHAQFRPLYETIIERYGLRFRENFDLEVLTSIIRALSGLAVIEWQVHPGTRQTMRPTGPGGEEQPWSLSGITVEGLATVLLEADPDTTVVAADLSTWHRPPSS